MELYARPNVNLVDVVFDVYDSGPSIEAPEHVYGQNKVLALIFTSEAHYAISW